MAFAGSVHKRGDDGDNEDDDAEHHEDHACPPALARGVDQAHALDALLMAAGQEAHGQLLLWLQRCTGAAVSLLQCAALRLLQDIKPA